MKRLIALFISLSLMLCCFVGCSNSSDSTEKKSSEKKSNEKESNVSVLKDGEFDPKSIVKDSFISFGQHYYNGGGKIKVVFPTDFEIEITSGLYLKTMVRNSLINSSCLDVVSNNQLLGTLEFYFVGEELAYNDINKLTQGDTVKLVVREHDSSTGLEDNLAANNFTWVKLEKIIKVPDLGKLYQKADKISQNDIDSITAIANIINSTPFLGKKYTIAEQPVMVFKGTAKSATVIGDPIKVKLVFKRTYDTGKTDLYVLTTEELTKHSEAPATCYFNSSKANWYSVDISETDMVAKWDNNYIWEKINK